MNVRTEMVLEVGLEQADRAEHAGRRRDEHGADPEPGGHLGGEQRPVAAERDEAELARVAAALDRDGADRTRHPRAAEQVDAVGRLLERQPERRRDLVVDGAPGEPAVEPRARSAAARRAGSRGTTLASVSVASVPPWS